MPAKIRPAVHASQFSKAIVTIAGADGAPVDIDQAATSLGHPVGEWQPWAGGGGSAGHPTSKAGVVGVAEAGAMPVALSAVGLDGAGHEVLLNTLKVTVSPGGQISILALAELVARMAGRGDVVQAMACCLACTAQPRPASITDMAEITAYDTAASAGVNRG